MGSTASGAVSELRRVDIRRCRVRLTKSSLDAGSVLVIMLNPNEDVLREQQTSTYGEG